MSDNWLIEAMRCDNLSTIKKFFDISGYVNGLCCLRWSRFLYKVVRNLSNSAGSNRNLPSDGTQLLHVSSKRFNRLYENMILHLINSGVNVNVRDQFDLKTPLMLAFEYNRSNKVVEYLLDAGSDIYAECKNGMTPLMYAIKYNYNEEIIRDLIIRGSDVNQRSSSGWTSLFFAVERRKSLNIITMLIGAGADVLVHDDHDRNVLMVLNCKASYTDDCESDDYNCENVKYINILLRNGVSLKHADVSGNTVLHLSNCRYLISLAVKHGVSINVKNSYGLTPLMYSIVSSKFNKLHYLLQFHADPNDVVSDAFYCLIYGFLLLCSDKNIVTFLYYGADLNAGNSKDCSPLHSLVCATVLARRFSEHSVTSGFMAIIKHYLLFINGSGLNDYFSRFSEPLKKDGFAILQKCQVELSKMRRLFIIKGLSFYYFCQLKKLFWSKSLRISCDQFLYSYYQIKELFPIYSDFIIMRVRDNQRDNFKRTMLLKLQNISVTSRSFFGTNSSVILDFDCLFLIGHYLNHKQLYNLFLASLLS